MHLYLANNWQLDIWLGKFVLEERRMVSTTLQKQCMLFVAESPSRGKPLQLSLIAGFKVLDGTMKQLRCSGLGAQVKQAEPITSEKENTLWEEGVLGELSPHLTH